MEDIKIIDATIDDIMQQGLCEYKNIEKPGYPEKFFPIILLVKQNF